MPTVIRKIPSARPLNGSMIVSTSAWYSVSAISRPAINAPTIGDSPTAAVARLAPITTSSDAARNSSGLLVRAACPNSRGRAKRPRIIIAAMTSPPCHSVVSMPSQPSPAALGAMAPRMKMIGTIMMSSNSSIDSAARPTGECVPAIGSTMAVDENASAKPSASAPVQNCPIIDRAIASELPITSSSIAPSPKTSLRICHSRLKLSSSPIVNSSRMMPNSAKGSSASGSDIVM